MTPTTHFQPLLTDQIWAEFLKNGSIFSLSKGKILIGWGIPECLSEPHLSAPSFYVPDFFLKSKKSWLYYSNWGEFTLNQILECLKKNPLPVITWQTNQQTLFEQAFNQLKADFASQQLEKAVPYIFTETVEQMNSDRLQLSLIQALWSLNDNDGYLYGSWSDFQGFLGLSPETLFIYQSREDGHILQTMALAGTCSSSESLEAFQSNVKEVREHQIVVEGIEQSLSSFGQVKINQRQILALPGLYHLMTPISVDLTKPFDFETIVRLLHPTPALGAFPRQQGQRWLEEYNQKIERGSYGAPFGIFSPVHSLSICIVGIRQVQWSKNGMRIGAGCGIIQASHCIREWDEIQLKFKNIQQLLAL